MLPQGFGIPLLTAVAFEKIESGIGVRNRWLDWLEVSATTVDTDILDATEDLLDDYNIILWLVFILDRFFLKLYWNYIHFNLILLLQYSDFA